MRRPSPHFEEEFGTLFEAEFPRLFRFMDRLSGDPDSAADTTQEAFVKLLGRGAMPDSPRAWLYTVALNLFRNARATRTRRQKLLLGPGPREAPQGPPPPPEDDLEQIGTRQRVRAALDRIPQRDRSLLLLRAEGLRYREMAQAMGLNEASVGTLLARAKKAFREAYEGGSNAP